MDSDGLPMIGSGVDYTQVGAIHQKRTLAFINYFITNTVSFLNNFSRSCETRLQKCNSKLQKLEAAMEILEAKLSSIPGLDDVSSTVVDTSQMEGISLGPSQAPAVVPEVTTTIEISTEVQGMAELPQVPEVPSGMVRARDDPVYQRFYKMLKVGVPEPAVRDKMKLEGLNPELLSNPDQLVPSSSSPTGQDNQDSADSSSE